MLYPVFHYTMLDNALNEFLNNNRAAHVQTTTPAINVKENQAGYEIELAAPGMTKDDFHVSVDKDGVLNIKMEHKDENSKRTALCAICAVSSHTPTLSSVCNCPTTSTATRSSQE